MRRKSYEAYENEAIDLGRAKGVRFPGLSAYGCLFYLLVRPMGDDAFGADGYNSKNFQRSSMMKHYRIVLAIAVLVLSSLACQALTGSPNNDGSQRPSSNTGGNQQDSVQPTDANSNPGGTGSDSTVSTEFPMTDDAYDVTEQAGTLIYFTKLSLNDALKFYRDQYAARGYKERETLTSVSDNTFNIAFDGDPSGKAVIVQSVDLGNGSRSVTVRLEAISQ